MLNNQNGKVSDKAVSYSNGISKVTNKRRLGNEKDYEELSIKVKK